MRPEAVRKALLESESRPAIIRLNDGTRLPVRSLEHWMIGPEFLYVRVKDDVHRVAFRNIAAVSCKSSRRGRAG